MTMGKGLWFKLFLLILGCAVAVFLPVYFVGHPYRPKSFISILLGIIGSSMMVSGAFLYALRKRVTLLKKLGKTKHWLDFHITFCILGPLLIVYHTAFTVKALNSAVAFYTMLIVVTSGLIGKYIYSHFQFTLSGERATVKEMNQEIGQLDQKINEHFPESQMIVNTIKKVFELREKQKASGVLKSFYTMFRVDRLEKKLRRQIRRFLLQKGRRFSFTRTPGEVSFENILMKRISLEKKISVLEATTKSFSYWHDLHVPLIWILFFSFIVHVAAVLIF